MRKPFRFAVAGPGGLGSPSIREVLRLPEFELVGVLAYPAKKNGEDAGELVGAVPCGISATTDFEAFKKLDA
jgi:4-hydroxy-tetrahydrodipicolinate reductase